MPDATTMNPPRGDRRSKPCATRRRALELLAVGLSRHEAARAVGVDPKTLRRWLAEAAERLPPPEPRSDDGDRAGRRR
jgi:transposase-like protein